MIEIICNEGESNKNVKDEKMRRPKNIKQIGQIDSNRKIYIEDYAFTFINSIAYTNADLPGVGVLLGEFQKNGEESYIFIKGVIKVKMPEESNMPRIYFNDSVWTSIYEESEKYFHNLEIVGWFVSLPDITKEIFTYLSKLHVDNFAGNNKTMYVINTSEKEENFYLYEGNALNKQTGYVCFYERNNEMQEYMLESRGERSVDEENEDRVIQNFRSIIREKKEAAEQKKTASLLYGVSAFMLIVVMVIGINVMNSYEKMQNFDASLNEIVKEISNMNVKIAGADDVVELESQTSGVDEVTPVTKIVGNVYPTEAESSQAATTSNASTVSASAVTAEDTSNATQATKAVEQANVTSYITYIVAKGDTLMSICKNQYGDVTKYKEVMAVNNIDNPDKLYVGQEIKLP